MRPNKIKNWLKGKNKDREWPANGYGTSRLTVDGGLLAGRTTPSSTLKAINRLMADEISLDQILSLETFLKTQQIASNEGTPLDEWAGQLIRREFVKRD